MASGAARCRRRDTTRDTQAAADSSVNCDTDAWRRAPKLALRRNGRVREAATGERADDESDDDVASYDGVEDATARREVEQANKALAEARPVKKKRGADGSVKLLHEGEVYGGAAGFADMRKKQLGEAVFERVYASTNPQKSREDVSDIDGEDDVDELYEGTDNPDYQGSRVTSGMVAAALEAEDAKQSRRPVSRREKSDKDEDEAGKGKRRPRARKPRKKVQRESIPRDGAACLVLVPARGGEPRRLRAVAPDASLILGRDYAEGGDSTPPSNFFAACPNEKCPRISRKLVQIETKDNKITVANLAKKDTQRVLLDGVVVKFDAPVPVTGTAPLHLGSALVCKEGGDVRAYVVTPTDDKFLLPVDDGFDFADDDVKKRGREPSGAADDPICLEGDEGAAEDDLFARKKKKKKKVGALCGNQNFTARSR
jgi:hypothetical protein